MSPSSRNPYVARSDQWGSSAVLWAAAIYNFIFGAFALIWPTAWFELSGMEPPTYPFLWQCIGMIVGVYGVGYACAARDPIRHWPIILVGLLGKVLGPIGFMDAALRGDLPWQAGWLIISNDLIWWIPFTVILIRARAHHQNAARSDS